MANPVSVFDLEARWRPLSTDEQTVASSLLDDAWQILLAQTYTLQARLDAGTLATDLVRAVECAMVLRVMRNPDGKRSESIDDYQWTRDNAVSAGLLYLTDDERELLSPAGATGDAFTVTPYGQPGYASKPLNAWELNL